LLHHSLLVDSPQIHNEGLLDMQARLDACLGFWEGRRWQANANQQTTPYDANQALAAARAFQPQRYLAVLSLAMQEPAHRLREAGAELRASENGVELWLLPPLEATVEN